MKTNVHKVTLSKCSRRKTIVCVALAIACLVSDAAIASTGGVASQLQATTTKSALLGDLQQNLQIFAVAAQKYSFENTGGAPWNQNQSTTPVNYAPFLLYAGTASSPSQAASVCGFTPGSGTAVAGLATPAAIAGIVNDLPSANQVSWTPPTRFLPSKWNPAFKGTYCAVVALNQPAPQQATLTAYYVAPNGTHSSSLNIQMAPSAVAFKGSEAVQQAAPKTTAWKPLWKPLASSTSRASWVAPQGHLSQGKMGIGNAGMAIPGGRASHGQ